MITTGILSEVISRMFGIKCGFYINRLVSSVGVTPTLIAPNNPNRIGLVVINLGAADLIVSFDVHPAAGHGILIGSGGGGMRLKWDEDFILCGLPIHAISLAGNCDVYVLEVEGLSIT